MTLLMIKMAKLDYGDADGDRDYHDGVKYELGIGCV
jgi:hypothetical protein